LFQAPGAALKDRSDCEVGSTATAQRGLTCRDRHAGIAKGDERGQDQSTRPGCDKFPEGHLTTDGESSPCVSIGDSTAAPDVRAPNGGVDHSDCGGPWYPATSSARSLPGSGTSGVISRRLAGLLAERTVTSGPMERIGHGAIYGQANRWQDLS